MEKVKLRGAHSVVWMVNNTNMAFIIYAYVNHTESRLAKYNLCIDSSVHCRGLMMTLKESKHVA
jgi:hypothetical protein